MPVYQPAYHREDDLTKQHALILARPLGLLITNGHGGLTANPVPFRLHPSLSKLGTLRAHLARANPQWRDAESLREVLVVFQDTDAYITPSWYETKRESGKVVPTWNYATVHAYGAVRVIEDREWLRQLVDDLTSTHEAGRVAPWAVADAPAEYIDQMMLAIVGIEINISRIEGKWKVSQNRSAEDQAGIVAGLLATGDERSLRMANLIDAATKPSSRKFYSVSRQSLYLMKRVYHILWREDAVADINNGSGETRTAGEDLLSGDGSHGLPQERRDTRTRRADGEPCLDSHDAALRPAGGRSDAR